MKPKPTPRPLPPKPAWYEHALKTIERVDKMRPTKSGRRESDQEYAAWLAATQEKGYTGTEGEWRVLLWRLRRATYNKRPWRQQPDD